MTVALLICHGLLGVALLGALTHQTASLCLGRSVEGKAFAARYARVDPSAFCTAVIVLYVATFILGSVIYPVYRLDVRIPLEEMRLGWALGLFEMKEHFGGIGLAALPLYAYSWKAAGSGGAAGRLGITALLAFITWFDFLVGHVLNNLRGLWNMKRISLPWFSIAFSVAYVVVFALDLSLFLYYPLVKEIHLMPQGEALGPAMHWYGMLALSAIAGLIVSLIARDHWIPARAVAWLWLVPAAALAGCAYLLRQFFA